MENKTYTQKEVLHLMYEAFEQGFKKFDIVDAGLEGKETDIECAWILKKYDNSTETPIEWLFKKLWDEPKDKFTWYALLNKAKEMDKNKQKELITEIMNEDQKDGLYKKQTAVDWLMETLEKNNIIDLDTVSSDKYYGVIQQAKQMEKEQIIHAFIVAEDNQWDGTRHGVHYYQQTYGTGLD